MAAREHCPVGIGRPDLHLAQELLFYQVWSSGAEGILRWRFPVGGFFRD
jgi:hypothetical protein